MSEVNTLCSRLRTRSPNLLLNLISSISLPEALKSDSVTKVLFEGDLAQSGQNSEALEVGNENASRTMFLRVKQYQPQREKTFDEAKSEVEAMVKREKAETALLAVDSSTGKTMMKSSLYRIYLP